MNYPFNALKQNAASSCKSWCQREWKIFVLMFAFLVGHHASRADPAGKLLISRISVKALLGG